MTATSQPAWDQELTAEYAALRPFWSGLDSERIVVPQCIRCRRLAWPPRAVCPACHSNEFEHLEVPQHGTLYSWVEVGRSSPNVDLVAPYLIGLVEVRVSDVGTVRFVGNIVGNIVGSIVGAADLDVGSAMTAVFDRSERGQPLLNWRVSDDPDVNETESPRR